MQKQENTLNQNPPSDTPKKNTILIVDDIEMNRAILYKIFSDEYTVKEAENGQVAMTIMGEEAVDLVLLDLSMPIMDGYSVITNMRNDSLLKKIPIIVTTGAEPKAERHALDLGADDFVSMPYDPYVVKKRAENLIQKYVLEVAQLQRELDKAEAISNARMTFLTQMSHELRTPMNAIIGEVTLAQQNLDDSNKVEKYLDKVQRSSKYLLDLINDILDISAIEQHKIQIVNTPFDINACFSHLIETYTIQCNAKGIRFLTDCKDLKTSVLIGDELRLQQVVHNLLSNAYKFTPVGGAIQMHVSETPLNNKEIMLTITVSDTGCGISDDALSRIFQPFEQAHQRQSSGGTGLGLAITKNLVELMGGTIDIDTQVNNGSKFSVSVPCRISMTQDCAISDDVASFRAIVIDDDPDSLEYASSILNHIGIRHDCVKSGLDALNLITKARNDKQMYTICLIDWKMPDIDGIDLTRRIRQACGDNPIIIVASAYDVNQINDADVDMCIAKPLFQTTLFNILMGLKQTRILPKVVTHPGYDFSGHRLLLVDDTDLNREIATELLRIVGFEIDVACDGQEALDIFVQTEPGTYSIILMDVQMPIMDGLAATRAIRQSSHPDAQTVNIIAMTANAFAEDIAASLSAGMNDHISKPIDTEILYDVLSRYVD